MVTITKEIYEQIKIGLPIYCFDGGRAHTHDVCYARYAWRT